MGIQPHVQSIKDKDNGDDNVTTLMMTRCSSVERESRWPRGEVKRASRDDELSYTMPDRTQVECADPPKAYHLQAERRRQGRF